MVMVVCIFFLSISYQTFCWLVQKLVISKIWQFIILNVLKIHVTRACVLVVILLVLTFVLQSTCFFCPAWESRMSSITESYFSKCIYLLQCSQSCHTFRLATSPVLSQLHAHFLYSCNNIFASQIMRIS